MFPIGKLVGASLVTEATEQLSAVNGDPKTTLVAVQFESTGTLIVPGAEIVGLVESVTVTI